MDLYHLHQEAEPSDRTALQSVVDHIEAEVARLTALEEHIMCEIGPEDERLQARAGLTRCAVSFFLPASAPTHASVARARGLACAALICRAVLVSL